MRGEIFILFIVIATLLAFAACVAFDASDCNDRGGVYVETLTGYDCVRAVR